MTGTSSAMNSKVWRDERRRGGKRCFQLLFMYARTLILILVYYVFSIGLTFYQKNLFKVFPFPLTVVIVHLITKFLLAGLCRTIWTWCSKVPRTTLAWGHFYSKVLPAGAAAGIDIGLSQWSLEFITITLYTMCKSTALLFILFFAILFKLEEMKWSVVVLVVLIAGGLCLFTYKYTQFHLFGFILVMTASLLSGLRWTLSQLLMQKSDLGLSHPVDLVYHVQPWMALSLVPLAAAMEGTKLAGSDVGFNYKDISLALFLWGRVMLGALIAFCMEISEYYVVSCTSSLTFSISGVAKEIATLSLAVYYFSEPLSTINQLGLLLCVLGISLHVFFKARASQPHQTDSPPYSDQQEPLLLNEEEEEMEMFSRRGFREEDEKLDPLETGGAHGGLGNLMGGGPIEDRAMGVCDGIKPATSFLGIDQ